MKYPPALLTPFLPTFPGEIPSKRILSAKNSARAPDDPPASPLSTFRMNTCKSVSKQRTLSPSRMNTYAKPRGRGAPPTMRPCRGLSSDRLASGASALRCFPHSIQFRSLCYRSVLMNLQVAPPFHRFASHVFSFTCKLLFSQLPCFQKHLRCPLVFPLTVKFPSVSRLDALPTTHYSLPTTHYPLLFLMLS
jgi:hypothetical protein